ncbi:hypothetical protein DFP72DRAFT_151786 [Ephemerocybe angulata]|uniref:Transmembrane protein n=1 Tax=Ephemerocybe angulata TaxID=980116 RepID=A0A8H6I652_9AGAR|nr:hypothetical protein DFP72DRAFT_151786 [Tulosesus angulatus]
MFGRSSHSPFFKLTRSARFFRSVRSHASSLPFHSFACRGLSLLPCPRSFALPLFVQFTVRYTCAACPSFIHSSLPSPYTLVKTRTRTNQHPLRPEARKPSWSVDEREVDLGEKNTVKIADLGNELRGSNSTPRTTSRRGSIDVRMSYSARRVWIGVLRVWCVRFGFVCSGWMVLMIVTLFCPNSCLPRIRHSFFGYMRKLDALLERVRGCDDECTRGGDGP